MDGTATPLGGQSDSTVRGRPTSTGAARRRHAGAGPCAGRAPRAAGRHADEARGSGVDSCA